MIHEPTHYQQVYFKKILADHFSVEEIETMTGKWASFLQAYDSEQERRNQGGEVEVIDVFQMLQWPYEKCLPHMKQAALDSNHSTYAMQVRIAKQYVAETREEARKKGTPP